MSDEYGVDGQGRKVPTVERLLLAKEFDLILHDSCYETVEHYLVNDDFPLLPLFRLGVGRTKQNNWS